MRRIALVGAAVVATGVLGAGTVAMTSSTGGAAATGEDTGTTVDAAVDPSADSSADAAFETAVVTRGDLNSEEDFSGTVGFGDEWRLPLQLDGIVTASSPLGTVVPFGSVLVTVDNQQVFLADGGMPMYRDLRSRDTSPHGL